MILYVNEIRSVIVDGVFIGFITRRKVVYGIHDYSERWCYAVAEAGVLRFQGALRSKKSARLKLIEMSGILTPKSK